MSTLLKWAQQSTGLGKFSSSSSNSTGGSSNGTATNNNSANLSSTGQKWIHPPESLQNGHVVYVVKFLGNTFVDKPKGIDVVKDGIRKLKFSQQLKKNEKGASTKMKKIELTISVEGVAIKELKTHHTLYQFPLHRISYCADDKGEKKFFAFITKNEQSSKKTVTTDSYEVEPDNMHECFVFVSDKLAEEITLTIGQAFDLAYRKFMDTSGRDLEAQKRLIIAQQQIKRLERDNNIYRRRLSDLSHFKGVSNYLKEMNLKTLYDLPSDVDESSSPAPKSVPTAQSNGTNNDVDNMIDISDPVPMLPPLPPRSKIYDEFKDQFALDDTFDSDDDFNPRFYEKNGTNSNNDNGYSSMNNHNQHVTPLLAPPPKITKRSTLNLIENVNENGVYNNTYNSGADKSQTIDIFGMQNFFTSDVDNAFELFDKKILEIQNGFSRGLSFGNDDFSLDSLDPLKN